MHWACHIKARLDQAFKYITATIREQDRLLEEHQTQNAQIENFQTRTQAYDTQIEELIAERDQLNFELLQTLRQHAASREPTPQPTAPTTTKSTKIPDPPILIDGKNPTFDSWLSMMKNKLKVNANHFANKEAKIAYIQLRTDGEASEHIQPRLEDNAADILLITSKGTNPKGY